MLFKIKDSTLETKLENIVRAGKPKTIKGWWKKLSYLQEED